MEKVSLCSAVYILVERIAERRSKLGKIRQ